jgi:antitoxin ParD1/3/4
MLHVIKKELDDVRRTLPPCCGNPEGCRADLNDGEWLDHSQNDSISLNNMPSSYTLGQHFEASIQAQLASGRYNNASEVVRDALRLMEERERRLAAVDAAIERGLADVRAGRVHDADAVFDELEARYTAMARERGEM